MDFVIRVLILNFLFMILFRQKEVVNADCPRDVDPCSSSEYTEINEPTRSTLYNITSNNEDDYSLPETWYRSVSGAGGDMPTDIVYTGQCNAYAPIYLTENLPSQADGITDVAACASFLDNHCARNYSIPIQNCGEYNVYCLAPVSDAFDRYCLGSETECDFGYTSDNGFTPGCEEIEGTTGNCPTNIDPCSHSVYVELNEPTRSTSYNLTGTNEDDYSLNEEWYRPVSGAGSDMPTEVVYTGQCNAYAPIYLTRSLPLESDGIVNMVGCASFLADTCVRYYLIPVKNCGDYNVYCLPPVSDAFDRYCIGSELQCETGYTSANGFTPGCEPIEETTVSASSQESNEENDSGKRGLPLLLIVGVIAGLVLGICICIGAIVAVQKFKRISAKETSIIQPHAALTTPSPMRPLSPPPPYARIDSNIQRTEPAPKKQAKKKNRPQTQSVVTSRPNTASSLNSISTPHDSIPVENALAQVS